MRLWLWFRRLSRAKRVALVLAIVYPIIILVMRDWGVATWIWLLVAAMTVAPFFVVNRLYPPVHGVDAYDPAHPSHGTAYWVELVVAVAAGALVVLLYWLVT